ncbi:MAG: DUF1566 domain-containing protein [Bacteroidales bacterium]|nr:DUF1566 domain-containing protein [Bacteroidales bacterium]
MRNYKRVYLTITLSLIVFLSVGQSPKTFKYQAVIRDVAGQVIGNQNVSFQISILKGSTNGTFVYTESHFVTTNQFGLVNLNIGNGATTDDFTNIDWGSNLFFIQIEFDQTGGTDYKLMGTSQLLSVPYALHAKTAESITGSITETDPVYTISEAANIIAADITNLGNLSGTNTGDQDLSALALKSNVLELDNITAFIPDADYEPATKKYVDDKTGFPDYGADTQIPFMNGTTDFDYTANMTFDSTNILLVLGSTSPPTASADASLIIQRSITGDGNSMFSGGNTHAFVDESTINRSNTTGGGIGYNSFDNKILINGAFQYDHIAGFQSRINYTSSGMVDRLTAFQALPTQNGGTASRVTGFEVRDPLGTGTITLNYGLYVKTLTRGGTNAAIVVGDSDVDQTLIQVGVTGTPEFIWDESEDAFDFNKKVHFQVFPTTLTSVPSNDYDVANKKYVDDNAVTTYSVGDFAQGGVVFWVDETGQYGLVCNKTDQSTGVRWYAGTDGDTRAYGDHINAGKMNTDVIIGSFIGIIGDDGSPYASEICKDLTLDGYSDWYLPSREELNLMYKNKTTIDATATANGGMAFETQHYWSSTEYDDGYSCLQNFSDGTQDVTEKGYLQYVRAVRAF